jgi:nicotinamidase-related amidase
MHDRKNGQPLRCVLVDLNTQRDFFEPCGACPVLEARQLYHRLRQIIAWARRNQIPVLSSLDSHRGVDVQDCCPIMHCVEGSPGHRKLSFTLFPQRVFVQGDNTIGISINLFHRYQQVIFAQRTKDLFANPKADHFMTQLETDEFILFGAVVERSIKTLALGLMARSKSVSVIVDGCGYWNRSEGELAMRQMCAKGAKLLTVAELRSRKLPRRWRYTDTGLVSAFRPNGNGKVPDRAKFNSRRHHDVPPG